MAVSLLLLALMWSGCDLGDEIDGVLPVQGGTNSPPVAIAGDDRQCRLGDRLRFDGSGSYDPDGRIVGHEWDFGDGSPPVREAVVQHLYPAAGEYAATLRVMDDRGAVAQDSVRVGVADDQQEVLNGAGCENNLSPIANAGGNQQAYIINGDSQVVVYFDGRGSYDPDAGQTATLVYSWDFGNGAVGSGPTPSTTYRDSGTYIVTLTIEDSCGAQATATCRVSVSVAPSCPCAGNQPPVANAGPDQTINLGQPVNLDGSGSSDPDCQLPLTYSWNFGDNTPNGATATVSHTYTIPGKYTVTLMVTDSCGASRTDQTVITVVNPCAGNRPPVANAGSTKWGVACQVISFSGVNSYDLDVGQTLTYSWAFGDGGTATGSDVTHAYASAAQYTVTLTVTDSCNSSHSAVTYAVINANTAPTANAGMDRAGTVGQSISFSGSATDPDPEQTLTYSWTSGNGQSASGQTPSFTYDAAGAYTVTLTVSDGCASGSDTAIVTIAPADPCEGNRPPVANAGQDQTGNMGQLLSFSGSGSSDPDAGQTLSYSWNYGDGSPSASGVNVSHSFTAIGTYTVTLTVTDIPCGVSATDTAAVTIANRNPVANAGPDQAGQAGQSLSFSGAASSDPDGHALSYTWNFGDGSPVASGVNVNHAYSSAGTYSVTLSVSDGNGGSATDTAVATISVVDPCQGNHAPTANAGSDKTGNVGQLLYFSGSGSSDPDVGQTLSYSWNYGDGSPTGSGVNVSHSFGAVGVYTVTLTVTDGCGGSAVDTAAVTIVNRPPSANAGSDKNAVACVPVSFTGSGSDPDAGQTLSYSWNFGDGTPAASGANVSHTYSSSGAFTATLTVTDGNGGSATDSALVTVTGNHLPVANAGPDQNGKVVGQLLSFSGSGSSDPDAGQTLSCSWDYGDGSPTGSGVNVSHSFGAVGVYTVTLTVTDGCGGSAVDTAVVTIVNRPPVANAGPDQTGNVGQLLAFSGSGSDPDAGQTLSYSWNFGDGSPAGSGASVSHAYSSAGAYTVTLTVSDGCGGSTNDTLVATITTVNHPPTANAGPDQSGQIGQSLTFSGSGSSDPDAGQTLTYSWNFGDGSPASSGVNVAHSFAVAGAYIVTLTVSDGCGGSATDTAVATITGGQTSCEGNQPPVANAGPDQSGSVGQLLSFSSSGSSDPEGGELTYSWNFGDGSPAASGASVSHAYTSAGTYTVALKVTDPCGSFTADRATVTITDTNGPLTARFFVEKLVEVGANGLETWIPCGESADDLIESGLRVRLNGTYSTGPISVHWWRKDGVSAGTGGLLFRTYTGPCTFTLRLTVLDSQGNSHQMEKTIHVAPGLAQMAEMPVCGAAYFYACSSTVVGTTLWSLSNQGQLAAGNVCADPNDPNNPFSPESLTLLSGLEPLNDPRSITSYGACLYLANRSSGVGIYRADRSNFQLVGRITSAQLENHPADHVVRIGDALYVGVLQPSLIYAFALTQRAGEPAGSPESPRFLASVSVGLPTIHAMTGDAGSFVAARSSSSAVTWFMDARDSRQLRIVAPVSLDGVASQELWPSIGRLGTRDLSGIRLIRICVESDSIVPVPAASVPGYGSAVLAPNRMYRIDGYYRQIWKYDTTDPVAPCLMESPAATLNGGVFDCLWFDPDGESGPVRPALLVSTHYPRFLVFRP